MKNNFEGLKIISAGAGSGKTYRLMQELVSHLEDGIPASGIIATTFTQKAAQELKERVRETLLEKGMVEQAEALSGALIGTVHSLGVKLLKRFSFEAGISPSVSILAEEDQNHLFNLSLSATLTPALIRKVERAYRKFGLDQQANYDWRKVVKSITDAARTNDFSIDVLQKSRTLSVSTFQSLLGDYPADELPENWEKTLEKRMEACLANEDLETDSTLKTRNAISELKKLRHQLKINGFIPWPQWAKLAKLSPGKASIPIFKPVIELGQRHDRHPLFLKDFEVLISLYFQIAELALVEFERHKKERGLIDYIDMESLVRSLLHQPAVRSILSRELDLLMVDEFQDTNPLQLDIFFQLSQITGQAVWVGDPKQSIYAFRGADPSLMLSLIEATGGIRPENIQPFSWRSRADIVHFSNAFFCNIFSQIPQERVALIPKRLPSPGKHSITPESEPTEMGPGVKHWYFQHEGNSKRPPGSPWLERCIAQQIVTFINSKTPVLPKGEKRHRPVQLGDIAVLCRRNYECQTMADALYAHGLQAALARTGLLQAPEIRLSLNCLRLILNPEDSLSVAEIRFLSSELPLHEIIRDRWQFIQRNSDDPWGGQDPFIRKLLNLRPQVADFAPSELLNLLLETLEIRRSILSWGQANQRLGNIEQLRQYSLDYEDACHRIHAPASIGGFLLWLESLAREQKDYQAFGGGDHEIAVLTYHKSKGLEWPVVICHNLHTEPKADVFDLTIMHEQPEIDLENLLGHRWLRLWVNPYGRARKNIPLLDRIMKSPLYIEKEQVAQEEAARLLYVGFTRARDFLILPTSSNPSKWLDCLTKDTGLPHPYLQGEPASQNVDWEGQIVPIEKEIIYVPEQNSVTLESSILQKVDYYKSYQGPKPHSTKYLQPDDSKWEIILQTNIENRWSYSTVPAHSKKEKGRYYGQALKAFIMAFEPQISMEASLEILSQSRQNFFLSTKTTEAWPIQAQAFYQFIQTHFSQTKLFKKYPFIYFHRQQEFKNVADFLVQDFKGQWNIIQNSGFEGKEKGLQKKIDALGPVLFFMGKAIQELFQCQMPGLFIHFPSRAELIEINVQQQDLFLE